VIPAVNIPNLQLIMPSSTLHQVTRGLKYLRDTLFIFITSHLHEAHYVASLFQIHHSSFSPPYFSSLYLNPNFYRNCYTESLCLPLVIIFCFVLFFISYIITLYFKGPFFRYVYLLTQNIIISSHYDIKHTLFQ